jgi:hypothetical protein
MNRTIGNYFSSSITEFEFERFASPIIDVRSPRKPETLINESKNQEGLPGFHADSTFI